MANEVRIDCETTRKFSLAYACLSTINIIGNWWYQSASECFDILLYHFQISLTFAIHAWPTCKTLIVVLQSVIGYYACPYHMRIVDQPCQITFFKDMIIRVTASGT